MRHKGLQNRVTYCDVHVALPRRCHLELLSLLPNVTRGDLIRANFTSIEWLLLLQERR